MGSCTTDYLGTDAALSEVVAWFRRVLGEATMGVALVDASPASFGRFLEVDRAVCTITGFSRQELLSADAEGIIFSEDLRTGGEPNPGAPVGHNPSFGIEKRYVHALGQPLRVSLRGSAVPGLGGVPMCFLVRMRTVADPERPEAPLRRRRQQRGVAQRWARFGRRARGCGP